MNALKNLKPEKVFEFFEMLSSVPHGSNNIWQISNLCCDFAKERGLAYYQDEVGNVIIYKGGSKGYEDKAPVIIQGHMDMVTVKNPDCDIDLEKDGLRLVTDGEYVWAEGTSLGADDGIAVAMALAVLDSDSIEHPPIEAVFTINEETGMDGAEFIDVSNISGRIMLNIDSEDEGIITAGCAGGLKLNASFSVKRSKDYIHAARIAIYGLTGGHSGAEIQKGRANSNILLGRLLSRLGDIRLISAKGGEKDNAIANKTICQIAISNFDAVKKAVEIFESEVKAEYSETDPDLTIRIIDEEFNNSGAIDLVSSKRIIKTIASVPDGVQKLSDDIPGLVQTSLNFGVLNINDYTAEMTFCLRSSVAEEKKELKERLEAIITGNRGKVSTHGDYPAWEYRNNSPLRDTAAAAFEKLYGYKPEISVIHAGLECGLLSDKITGLDCISFGPTIHEIHTTREKLDVASTERTWNFLLEILKSL
ncbi:MAG: aminoacyl-histidine dipeptidase [Bacillota bacterium]|nr:aminoacyl-histidine dipeptidase [Bacillota bacterium]